MLYLADPKDISWSSHIFPADEEAKSDGSKGPY